ncbi:hypothetical protein RI129_000737 [Pyrocoelia pectoralis]|uniref:Hedgehog protein n=1 Tax=Pyrocoelia pectoralis TaxID=417401 RepID=A0AAN7VUW7_9COLE
MCVVRDECVQEMRWCALGALLLALVLVTQACGPGRGVGRRRGPRKLTPLVFKQHVPNVSENTLTASGLTEGRIDRNNTRFRDLVPNYNQDIIFKDEEGTGADRLMTQRCKEKLNTLAISVMNQWPGVRLRVTEGWDEEGHHASDSLHYEGRAVDVTTSDRDRSKYGMLARLAVEAGFDWVYYESRAHIHCSVKSESSDAAKYGGCFAGDNIVQSSSGKILKLSELQVGEAILALDPSTNQLIYSEVILFLDWHPNQRNLFLNFELKSGRTLTLTPAHLVITGSLNSTVTVFAKTLTVGSILIIGNRDDNKFEDTIVRVTQVYRTGIYAPLTSVGTIVVNDIIVSCYAVVDSHPLAHFVFAPIRLTAEIKSYMYRLWQTYNQGLADNFSNVPKSSIQHHGIHWYAEILYKIANNFIPWRILYT